MPEANVVSHTISTPICPLRIEASPRGVTGVRFLTDTPLPSDVPGEGRANVIANQARAQLHEYFDRRRQRFELPLDWSAVDGWRHTVLQMLFDSVAFGETVGYGEWRREPGSYTARGRWAG